MRRLLGCIVATSLLMLLPIAATPARAGKPAYEPRFDTVACDDVVPADPRVECGTLTVPMDRAHPARGDVTLPVASIRSAAPDPLPDPIVYFSGGPSRPPATPAR